MAPEGESPAGEAPRNEVMKKSSVADCSSRALFVCWGSPMSHRRHLIALFSQSMRLEEEKKFRIFMRFYKLGLPILALTLTLFSRGIIRVLGMDLSLSMDLDLSGVTGKIDEHRVFCYTMECK